MLPLPSMKEHKNIHPLNNDDIIGNHYPTAYQNTDTQEKPRKVDRGQKSTDSTMS